MSTSLPLSSNLHRAHGFTLIEVMVVITIMAVLMALALPSFNSTLERWRVQQTTESMAATLYYARSEAIKRGGLISVRKNPNHTHGCTTARTDADWNCGWFVFIDTNNNGIQDAGEELLNTFNAPGKTNVTNQLNSPVFKIDRWGKITGLSSTSFIVSPQPKGTSDSATTAVCVSSGGRIRTEKNSTSCTP